MNDACHNQQRGIIKFIIIVIIAIAALAYFHVDLREWVERILAWWQEQDLSWFKEQFSSLFDKIR